MTAEARAAALDVAGLMCVPPDGVEAAPYFALAAKLAGAPLRLAFGDPFLEITDRFRADTEFEQMQGHAR